MGGALHTKWRQIEHFYEDMGNPARLIQNRPKRGSRSSYQLIHSKKKPPFGGFRHLSHAPHKGTQSRLLAHRLYHEVMGHTRKLYLK